jgi:hypothetical protein
MIIAEFVKNNAMKANMILEQSTLRMRPRSVKLSAGTPQNQRDPLPTTDYWPWHYISTVQ